MICQKCKKACNVYSVQRKVWTINPKTRIKPNKRKMFSDLISETKRTKKLEKNQSILVEKNIVE